MKKWLAGAATAALLAAGVVTLEVTRKPEPVAPTPPTAKLEQSDSIYTYRWSFGDGDSSTARNPRHTYQRPGVYDVRLIVTDPLTGLSDTMLKVAYITVYPLDPTHPPHHVRGKGIYPRRTS